MITASPQIILTIMAVSRGKSNIGTTNVKAIINFDRNAKKEELQMPSTLVLFSNSVEICMPKPSERASANAITIIPPNTATFEFVEEFNPMIRPRVVITPAVKPNPTPLFIASFI